MDDYLILTVISHAGEAEPDFASRLSHFWTYMLRQRPDDFARVYAETTAFETVVGGLERQYLIEADVADILETELAKAGLANKDIDRAETYSRYEATPPDWMQIEH
jgi:hypothetical protein